jgi:hypothetical protein
MAKPKTKKNKQNNKKTIKNENNPIKRKDKKKNREQLVFYILYSKN